MRLLKRKFESVFSIICEVEDEISCIGLMLVSMEFPKWRWSKLKQREFFSEILSTILGEELLLECTTSEIVVSYKIKQENNSVYIDDLFVNRPFPMSSEFVICLGVVGNKEIPFTFSFYYSKDVDGGQLAEDVHTTIDAVFKALMTQSCECEYEEED